MTSPPLKRTTHVLLALHDDRRPLEVQLREADSTLHAKSTASNQQTDPDECTNFVRYIGQLFLVLPRESQGQGSQPDPSSDRTSAPMS